MIENFEAVKKQLSQLAGVINSFKSEAVQLKIIELIFGESGSFEEDTSDDEKPKGKRKVRRKTVTKKEQGGGRISTSKKKTMGGTGAVATVTQLATGEFFKQPRTINDIIEHCKHNLARTFKANEFSGKLSRMVRNKELIRKKNKDGQYEYKKS
jgi:hypothetical protein